MLSQYFSFLSLKPHSPTHLFTYPLAHLVTHPHTRSHLLTYLLTESLTHTYPLPSPLIHPQGRPLIPMVKHERRDGTSSSSPYLAFRKRTEKMQTRKVSSSHGQHMMWWDVPLVCASQNRKNDEHAYMHMLKLKRDLSKAMWVCSLSLLSLSRLR